MSAAVPPRAAPGGASGPVRPPLRVAVVGTGYFARFHLRAWNRVEGAELVALHALDAGAGAAAAAEHGVPATFDDIDALLDAARPDVLDLVVPPHAHADLIRTVLARDPATRPALVCQKPFCADPDEAERVVDEIEAAGATGASGAGVGATVVVHENFRFQPWYAQIRGLLDAGALGELVSIRFDLRPGDGRGPDAYLARQPYFRDRPRFVVRETGVHLIDVFRYLAGPVTGLFARLARLNPVIAGEDAGTVLFDFASGARGTLDLNRLADCGASNPRLVMGTMRVEGTRATLDLDGDGRLWVREFGSGTRLEHRYAFDDVDFGGDCTYLTCRHVAERLIAGDAPTNLARDYLVNRRIEEAVYRSHEGGRWLALDAAGRAVETGAGSGTSAGAGMRP